MSLAENSDQFRQCYQALGVHQAASLEEVKSAYRRLARRCHPDLNPQNQDAENRFKRITAAYETLCRHLAVGQRPPVRSRGPAGKHGVAQDRDSVTQNEVYMSFVEALRGRPGSF